MGAIAHPLQGHIIVLIHNYFAQLPGPGGKVVLRFPRRGSDWLSVVLCMAGRSLTAWLFYAIHRHHVAISFATRVQ